MRVTIEQIRDEISDRLEVAGAWVASRTSRRTRWIGSTVIVLGLHVVFLWVLIISKTQEMRLPTFREDILPVELWEVPPPPEPEPVLKIERLPEPVPTPVEEVEPPRLEPTPQDQPAPQTVPQPKVIDSPRPSLTVKPVEMPDLVQKPAPTARNTAPRDVQLKSTTLPTVAAPPAPNLGVRKKNEDEQIAAKTAEAARAESPSRSVTALNLHTPPKLAPDAPTSGLTAAAQKPAGGSPTKGSPSIGLPPGALQGLNGTGLKGRSGVSQAIQNHNSCVDLQIKGKPLPEGCEMKDLASMGKMGPRPDRDFQTAAAKRDANMRYKTQPGSTDYWQRVNKSPSPGSGNREDGLPKKGTYADPKDARVMNGDSIDPINGN